MPGPSSSTAAAKPSAVFVNMAVPASTAMQALQAQVPTAASLKPTLATVWLNVNDVFDGVDPVVYGRQLRSIVSTLSREALTVLVANTPPLQLLPGLPEVPLRPGTCHEDLLVPDDGTDCRGTPSSGGGLQRPDCLGDIVNRRRVAEPQRGLHRRRARRHHSIAGWPGRHQPLECGSGPRGPCFVVALARAHSGS